jgi:hypothetical protein
MHIVRSEHSLAYEPPGHQGVIARRLQGLEAGGPAGVAVSISTYLPGSTIDALPVAGDTIYVVLAGALVLNPHDPATATTLATHDSVYLPQGEIRSVRNDSVADATLLVVLSPPRKGTIR